MVIVCVTGKPCSGKTFAGDYLELACGFAHIEGDEQLQAGGFGTEQTAQNILSCFNDFWFKDEDAPADLWVPYVTRICEQAKSAQEASSNTVISWAVFRRQVRDFIREQLGSDIHFVLMDVNKAELGARNLARLKKYAGENGLSVDEIWKGPVCPGCSEKYGDFSDERFIQWQVDSVQKADICFDTDEINCFVVDANPKDESVVDELRKVLGLPVREEPVDTDAVIRRNFERYKKAHEENAD